MSGCSYSAKTCSDFVVGGLWAVPRIGSSNMTTTTYVGVDLSGGTGGTSCLLVQTDSSCTLNPRCLFGKCVLCMGGGRVGGSSYKSLYPLSPTLDKLLCTAITPFYPTFSLCRAVYRSHS